MKKKLPCTITLDFYIQTIIGYGIHLDKAARFREFIVEKHIQYPTIFHLAYTNQQGGHFMWDTLYNLWDSLQFDFYVSEEERKAAKYGT